MESEEVLECSKCNTDCLHQESVVVFQREEDKQEHITLVGRHFSNTRIEEILFKNPSRRRQGVNILFSCENCGGAMVLQISQDKGQTTIGKIFVDTR